MTKRPAKASRTRTLFVWLNQVKADPELSPNAFKVAYEIGQHFNSRHGGAAWPSSLTIATHIGVGKATVIRVVRQLRERGHLKIDPGKAGRGHSNRCRMSKPGIKGAAKTSASGGFQDAEKRSASEPFSEPIKGPSETRKGPPVDLNYLEPSTEDAKASSNGEREERSLALAGTPGALAPNGGAPKEKFKALLSIWKRPPHGDEDEAAGWQAFVVECSKGDPNEIGDEIVASGHRWVAAYRDEPNMLKPLWKWLALGTWKHQPDKRQPKRNAGKVSLAGMARDEGRRGGGEP